MDFSGCADKLELVDLAVAGCLSTGEPPPLPGDRDHTPLNTPRGAAEAATAAAAAARSPFRAARMGRTAELDEMVRGGVMGVDTRDDGNGGRGLHSFTIELNSSNSRSRS
jgi:hypothetical protein